MAHFIFKKCFHFEKNVTIIHRNPKGAAARKCSDSSSSLIIFVSSKKMIRQSVYSSGCKPSIVRSILNILSSICILCSMCHWFISKAIWFISNIV